MIRKFLDKFIRIVYDDLKVFLVFFLVMQIGTLYVPVKISFLTTILFSSAAYFINGYSKKDNYQKLLPFIGIVCSFLITVILYKEHTIIDKGVFTLYHLMIWIVSARNLRERILAKRTLMYVFMPIIVITLLLIAVYFSGVPYEDFVGVIYPYLIMFYAVTFMLAVKMNLDQGYKSVSNRTINTINKRSNRVIYSYIPNLIIVIIFIFVINTDYQTATLLPAEEGVYVEQESSSEVVVIPMGENKETKTEYKAPTEKEKMTADETDGHSFNFDFNPGKILKYIVEAMIVLGILYAIYRFFKRTHHKSFEEDEEELLETRESLLTRENIKQYFNNIRNKFKKKNPVDISTERKLYKKVVLYFIKNGYSFRVADTPRQFSSKVQEGVLDEATDMYEAYRYGKKVISTSQLNRIEKKINDK